MCFWGQNLQQHLCERTLVPIHPLPRGWTFPLPHKQRSRAAEKFPMAAVLMWATSKFLMDGSTITEEGARDCHESRATGRERRGLSVGVSHDVPKGCPRASSRGLHSRVTHSFIHLSILQQFFQWFLWAKLQISMCSSLGIQRLKIKTNEPTKAWAFLLSSLQENGRECERVRKTSQYSCYGLRWWLRW